MTHGNTAASPSPSRLPLPRDADLDERSRRARKESMAVTAFGTHLYEVTTEGGSYLVNLAASTCTCPDYLFRDARCKHLRRVAIEINEGLVPPPGQIAVTCRDCSRELFVDADRAEDGPHYCPVHRIAPGDQVRDRETGRRLVAVTQPVGRAGTVEIPGEDVSVAEYSTNEGYGPDEPVVGAVYPVARLTDEGIRPETLRVYTFPRTRLIRVDPAPERD